MVKRIAIKVGIFGAIAIYAPALVMACPNCKNAVDQSHSGMAQGFGISIVLMLMIPLTLVTCWAIAFFALRRVELEVDPINAIGKWNLPESNKPGEPSQSSLGRV